MTKADIPPTPIARDRAVFATDGKLTISVSTKRPKVVKARGIAFIFILISSFVW